MKKKTQVKKVKISSYERYIPEGNVLKAKIEEPVAGYGRKVAFNNRHVEQIGTGVEIENIPAGYVVSLSLAEELSIKGMVLTNNTVDSEGEIKLTLVNCGREIVNVIDGQEVAYVHLQPVSKFDWSF